ncbi:hypothetical protein Hanom_Chr17g01580761 [Helianthus anomalus]
MILLLLSFLSLSSTCLTIAEQFLDIKRTSPEGNFNVADFPSFANSFATAPVFSEKSKKSLLL